MARKQTKRTRPAQKVEEKEPEAAEPVAQVTNSGPIMYGQVELGAYYQVIPSCVLFFTHMDQPVLWAKAGQVVQADHTVLAEMIDLQFGQVNKVDPVPDDAEVVGITRSDILNLMAGRRETPANELATQRMGFASTKAKAAPAID